MNPATSPFTATGLPEAEAKITADLRAVVDAVVGQCGRDGLHSILLTGGFGRGEGSVRQTASGVRVMNDYDLAIIPKTASRLGFVRYYRRHHAALERLAGRLASELKIKQVDLGLRPHSYFRRPAELRIENYEVRQGHRLLFGQEDPCHWMPAWQAGDLPLFDGIWLFRNRGMGLLLARLYLLESDRLADADRENFFIECNKARLAMGDALLLLERRYDHLYRERLQRAREIQRSAGQFEQEILAEYIEALEQKLWPREEYLNLSEPLARWRELAATFSRFFLLFETVRLGRPFANWVEYSATAKPENRVTLRTFGMALVRSGGRSPRAALLKANRGRNIELIGLLLAAATSGGQPVENLARAAALLGRPVAGDPADAWLDLTLATLRLMHPGGEVGRVLARFQEQRRHA